MNTKYMIGIDQSTSGTKIVVVDDQGSIVFKKSKSHKQYYPKPGWVEHDPMEIYNNVIGLLKDIKYLKYIKDKSVKALSITNQRETIVLWDSVSQEPLCNAIVWQCRRSSQICENMKQNNLDCMVEEKTGLQLDPYFSASKIKWAIENHQKVKESLGKGTLRIGTIDTWLIYKLTKGLSFLTDHSNASRTMLYNIVENDWDDELLSLFQVERGMLAEIKSSNECFGYLDEAIVNYSIPIVGVIGDSQGALFGQQCFTKGMAKATYGTGSSILMYTGKEVLRSDKGLLTSVAWGLDGQVEYALEGIINSSGDTLKWLKDNLGLYQKDEDINQYIEEVTSCEGVYIIPGFVGLGAPYWKPKSRASIVGMTRITNKAHIIRAGVESMAYQVADLVKLLEEETSIEIDKLRVDGGPTNNEFLMQFQSDLLQKQVECSYDQELSVLGAIYLGGLGIGIWSNLEQLESLQKSGKMYKPKLTKVEANTKLKLWNETVMYHS